MPKKKYKAQGGIGFGMANVQGMFPPSQYAPSQYGGYGTGGTGGGGGGFDWSGLLGTGRGATNPFSAGAGVLGGLFGGIGAYQQAQSQKSALGTALGHARQIPGMYEEAYAPGIERAGDIYSAYKPRGSMYQGLKRGIAGGLTAGQTNLPPHLRKLMGRENLSKAEGSMQQMLPQFAQAQQQAAGQLTGLEVGLGQGKIGAQQNIAELEAARKGINPTASAFGNIGATLMSFVQGGGKLPHGGEVRGPHHAAGGVDAGKDVEVQGGEYVVNAISANKHKALLESINRDDNEMTVMDGMFGEKHSAYGYEVYQAGGKAYGNEDYQAGGKFQEGSEEGMPSYEVEKPYSYVPEDKWGESDKLDAIIKELYKVGGATQWENPLTLESLREAQSARDALEVQDTARYETNVPPMTKQAGGIMSNETLLNRIIKDTYGKR